MINYEEALSMIRNQNRNARVTASFEIDNSFVFSVVDEDGSLYSGKYYSIDKESGQISIYNYWGEYYSNPEKIVKAQKNTLKYIDSIEGIAR